MLETRFLPVRFAAQESYKMYDRGTWWLGYCKAGMRRVMQILVSVVDFCCSLKWTQMISFIQSLTVKLHSDVINSTFDVWTLKLMNSPHLNLLHEINCWRVNVKRTWNSFTPPTVVRNKTQTCLTECLLRITLCLTRQCVMEIYLNNQFHLN